MKILLVDDHALFAKSPAIALSDFPQIERFEIVKDIRHLDVAVCDVLPDILLIDINLGKAADEDGLHHIFEKLEVGSAVEAVARAVQLGHIPPLQ